MENKVIEIVGWYGVVAIVGAYALSSFNLLDTHSFTYQLLNLTGAVGIITEALHHRNYQPAVLNVIWAVVALVALLRIVF